MNDALDAFRQGFQLDRLTLLESPAWILSLRPGQLTLGAMVLSARSGATSFGGLDEGSGAEFLQLVRNAESVTKTLFGAARLNCIALMLKDPVVHFHLLPRYENAVDYLGLSWVDEDWPKPPVFREIEGREQTLDELMKIMKVALSKGESAHNV